MHGQRESGGGSIDQQIDNDLTRNLQNLSLEQLGGDGQTELFDTLDQLSRAGIQRDVGVPQIVVCGDQSSGKSSLLEALTGIALPRGQNMCTRFATQLSLRRAHAVKIQVSITPCSDRPAEECALLEEFSDSLDNYDGVPGVITRAGLAMEQAGNAGAFGLDVLRVLIEGPQHVHLNIVDLPGLIHAATRDISEETVKAVDKITNLWIDQPRTICLAVISAANDIPNQIVLKKVQQADPTGQRTLGVITKPDLLVAGSPGEQAYVKLAQNENISFELGWHVVKNRSHEERDRDAEQRNLSEYLFFENSPGFGKLSAANVGIDSLRQRLSRLLLGHLIKELPQVQSDIETQLKHHRKQLENMSEPRSSAADCKRYLSNLYTKCRDICRDAVFGYYGDLFFSSPTNNGHVVDEKVLQRRLRANIEISKSEFARYMQKWGHKFNIDSFDTVGGFAKTFGISSSMQAISELPISLTQGEANTWASEHIRTSKGRELPDTFNPLAIDRLFGEQSRKWSGLADAHVDTVNRKCLTFLDAVLREQCEPEVRHRLQPLSEILEARFESARRELENLKSDLKGHVSTNDPQYESLIESRRQRRADAAAAMAESQSGALSSSQTAPVAGNAVSQGSTLFGTGTKPTTSGLFDITTTPAPADAVSQGSALFSTGTKPSTPSLFGIPTTPVPAKAGSKGKTLFGASAPRANSRTASRSPSPAPTMAFPTASWFQSNATSTTPSSSLQHAKQFEDLATCEKALDGLAAIYQIQLMQFIANVNTQVIERHIMRGLEDVFAQSFINEMKDAEVEAIAGESQKVVQKRQNLQSRIHRLSEAKQVLSQLSLKRHD